MNQLMTIHVLGVEDAKRIVASPDEPHQHDYEELIVGVEGELEHFIDFHSETVEAPYVSYVSNGKVHRVIPRIKDGKCKVWVIRFRSEFIPETTFNLYPVYHAQANVSIIKGECFSRIDSLCEVLYKETIHESPDFSVVQHLLSALFSMIEAERKRTNPAAGKVSSSQNITFKNFLKILEENYRRPEGVEFYASKLFMTSRNLNNICQNILQQSISEIIETRKLTEAKNLLMTTDKTISEIGFELGYNEKSYFTNVFKKKTGQTPSEFRDEMKKLI